MSVRERDRLKVIGWLVEGKIKTGEAAGQLGLSRRQIRRIRRRYQTEGDVAVVHRLRGRPSNRKLSGRMRDRVMGLVEGKYKGFGPTLAAEYIAEKEKIQVSRETLRQWMSGAGLWKPRKARMAAVHVWRERRACFGELVQWDTSEHDWLEGRSQQPVYLISMIDDATSRLYGRFVDSDSTLNNLRVLSEYLQGWGRPVAFYTDKGSVFKINRPSNLEEQLDDVPVRTQVGRALAELDIESIKAHSPQAKGRIERSFGTLQDRLVKGMRLAKVRTLDEANRYLQDEFLPMWNHRFVKVARNPMDAHRPLQPDHRLDQILSVRELRTVANDYTVRWNHQTWQIDKDSIVRSLKHSRISIEQRLDGTVALRFKDRYLPIHPCTQPDRKQETPVALRAPSVSRLPNTQPKRKYIPPPDHPWRRTLLLCTKADISTLR